MAVVRRAKQVATYADIEALPPNVVGELVGGELFVSPRPSMPHAVASGALQAVIGGPFGFGTGGGPGGWWIVPEPELHFGDDIVVPDVAGWRRERMPVVPRTAAVELAPDWLCEVLSPSTAGFDRSRKLDVYARAGVRHVWLVDPINRTLEILRLDGARWMVAANHSDLDRVRAEPFEAVEFDLSLWWGDVPVPAPPR